MRQQPLQPWPNGGKGREQHGYEGRRGYEGWRGYEGQRGYEGRHGYKGGRKNEFRHR